MSSLVNYHYLLKYIIVGDSFVGKSNILLQFIQHKFKADHEITIGVEFGAKNITIDDKVYRIQIWDTAGQETFRSITRAYYKNSACAFLVYDISKKESFNNIISWLKDCKAQSPKTVYLVLVGNKQDLEDKREVTYEEGKEFALKNKMEFFECSAKSGYNINELFETTCLGIAKKIKENYYDLSSESSGIKTGSNSEGTNLVMVDRDTKDKNDKGGCC